MSGAESLRASVLLAAILCCALSARGEYSGTTVSVDADAQCGEIYVFKHGLGRLLTRIAFDESPAPGVEWLAAAEAEAARDTSPKIQSSLHVAVSEPLPVDCAFGSIARLVQLFVVDGVPNGSVPTATRIRAGFEVRTPAALPEGASVSVSGFVQNPNGVDEFDQFRQFFFRILPPYEIEAETFGSAPLLVEELSEGVLRVTWEVEGPLDLVRRPRPEDLHTVIAKANVHVALPVGATGEFEIRGIDGIEFDIESTDADLALRPDTSFSSPGTDGPISPDGRRCIAKTTKAGLELARAQRRHLRSCLRLQPKTRIGGSPVHDCTRTDERDLPRRSPVARATRKLRKADARWCKSLPSRPGLGYADPGLLKGVALGFQFVPGQMFGVLDFAFERAGNKGDRCIRAALLEASRAYDGELKAVVERARGSIEADYATLQELYEAVFPGGVRFEAKDELAARLERRLQRACGTRDFEKLMSGDTFDGTFRGFSSKTATSIRCRVCAASNSWYGFAEPCDEFDDGSENDSCRPQY